MFFNVKQRCYHIALPKCTFTSKKTFPIFVSVTVVYCYKVNKRQCNLPPVTNCQSHLN